MTNLFILISLVVIGVSIYNWRYGLILVIVVGVLQDPMRKLAPSQSGFYTLWAAAVFMFTSLIAILSRANGGIKELFLNDPRLRNAWILYLTLLGIQIVQGLLRWQSLPSSMLGVIVYIGPVIALLVSFGYATSEKYITRFMKVYLVFTIPVVFTVYLSESYSEDWEVLREIGSFVGRELVIYDLDLALKSYSGLFRVGEIAAWHGATCCMFIITLMANNKSLVKRCIAGLLIMLLVGAIVLTGRRKMLMTLTIFLVLHGSLLSIYFKSALKQAVSILIVGVIGFAALLNMDEASTTALYFERGKTVYEDAGTRVDTSIALSKLAIEISSGLGLGIGLANQGGQFINRSGNMPNLRGSQEPGLGKIVLELGIPGLLLLGYLIGMTAYTIFGNFKLLNSIDQKLLMYSVSFSSILFANVMTFFIATQVYGDLYILVILGIVAGMLFSVNAKGVNIFRQRSYIGRTTSS